MCQQLNNTRPKSLLDAPSRPAQREAVDEAATNRRQPASKAPLMPGRMTI